MKRRLTISNSLLINSQKLAVPRGSLNINNEREKLASQDFTVNFKV